MQKIIDDSVIISKFMGGKTECLFAPMDKDEINFQEKDYPETPHDGSCWKFNELKYHLSWDWLMPVIHEIIKRTGVKTIDECSDEEWFQTTRITRMYIGITIDLAFYYVVEYIKWHNKMGVK